MAECCCQVFYENSQVLGTLQVLGKRTKRKIPLSLEVQFISKLTSNQMPV